MLTAMSHFMALRFIISHAKQDAAKSLTPFGPEFLRNFSIKKDLLFPAGLFFE